ncbi:MAG: rod shape-determining protein MreD [Gemmatimonadaceae bacterium]|nr:rod shape-determining protein MreD [Gemmatimonadaceae bacterium]
MNAARGFWFALVVLALLVLHYTLRPVLDWRASIDFLAIAVLLVAVRARPGVAAIVGFAIGIASDALIPSAFGAGALAFTIVAYAASSLKAAFFADNLALNAIFVFLGKWVSDLVFLAAEHRLGGSDFLAQALLWSPLAAAATALVGLAVFAMARPLMGTPRG